MSLDDVDPVLTAPKRLAAMGMLVSAKEIEFAFIRDHLELGDSDLSKQLSALIDAGYASSRKTGKGRTRKTWLRSTKAGEVALTRHVAALNALVHDAVSPPSA